MRHYAYCIPTGELRTACQQHLWTPGLTDIRAFRSLKFPRTAHNQCTVHKSIPQAISCRSYREPRRATTKSLRMRRSWHLTSPSSASKRFIPRHRSQLPGVFPPIIFQNSVLQKLNVFAMSSDNLPWSAGTCHSSAHFQVGPPQPSPDKTE